MIDININSIPKLFTFCVKDDCPKAKECLRHEAGEAIMASGVKSLKILNLMNLRREAGSECTHYKSTESQLHGKGVQKYLLSLTMEESKRATQALIAACSSQRQYYRYRDGSLTIDPKLQEQMTAKLKEKGIEKPLFFDEVVNTYNFK